MTQVDWDLARRTGTSLVKTGPRITPEEAAQAVSELRELAGLASGHVKEFTQLSEPVPPPVIIVDRHDWVGHNIQGLKNVAELLQPSAGNDGGFLSGVAAKSTALQAGAVLAFVSGRVLGQFDVLSSDPGQLLLVAPNIVEAERKLRVDPRDFRLWVCLHEVTHRTQFGGVPWLRGHFVDRLSEFFAAGKESTSVNFTEIVGALTDSIKNPDSRHSLLDLVQNPAQREVVAELMALMTLLEGHADFVMDGVGPHVVGSVATIRARFEARRKASNPFQAAIRRLLGVELKLRQYAEGREFVDSVVKKVGITGFNAVWSAPSTLPSQAELAAPDTWLARVVE